MVERAVAGRAVVAAFAADAIFAVAVAVDVVAAGPTAADEVVAGVISVAVVAAGVARLPPRRSDLRFYWKRVASVCYAPCQ